MKHAQPVYRRYQSSRRGRREKQDKTKKYLLQTAVSAILLGVLAILANVPSPFSTALRNKVSYYLSDSYDFSAFAKNAAAQLQQFHAQMQQASNPVSVPEDAPKTDEEAPAS